MMTNERNPQKINLDVFRAILKKQGFLTPCKLSKYAENMANFDRISTSTALAALALKRYGFSSSLTLYTVTLETYPPLARELIDYLYDHNITIESQSGNGMTFGGFDKPVLIELAKVYWGYVMMENEIRALPINEEVLEW